MKKQILSFLCATALLSIGDSKALVPVSPEPEQTQQQAQAIAYPSTATVRVNGEKVPLPIYQIDGFHYVKLTDVSYVLDNTLSQFSVSWNVVAKVIVIHSDQACKPLGDELSPHSGKEEIALPFSSSIFYNGTQVDWQAYIIDGAGYVSLDVLSQELGLSVAWYSGSKTISFTADPIPEPAPAPIQTAYLLPADQNKDRYLTQEEIQAVFTQFEEQYPQGTYWTNDNFYITIINRQTTSGQIVPVRFTGYGCAGWTYMLIDAIFGTQSPEYTITREQLQVGDYWHTGSHWGVITAIQGDHYSTTEGNYNESIYWDIIRTPSYFTDEVTYFSRHPQA